MIPSPAATETASHPARFPAWQLGLIALGTVLFAVIVGATTIPLGVPGEWVWPRLPWSVDWWLGALSLAFWSGVWGLCVRYGGQRVERCGRLEFAVWITLLAGCVGEIHWALQGLAAPEAGPGRVAWVLYYPGSSGYFTQAISDPRPLLDFLRDHESLVAQGDVLHQGTHPPGLIVGYRLLMQLVDHVPGLLQVAQWSQPDAVRDAFDVLAQTTAATAHPLGQRDRAVLWLAGWCMWFCGAATVGPLYALLRMRVSPHESWYWVSLWAWVPAVAMFWPKSDISFAFWGSLLLDLWLGGLRQNSLLRCFLAGLIGWLGLFQSLALLPVGFLAVLLTVVEWRSPTGLFREMSATQLLKAALAGGAGLLLPIVLLWLIADCNLLAIWSHNYRNHAAFYAQYPRSYIPWLLVNPLELVGAAGPALVLAVMLSNSESSLIRHRQPAAESGPHSGPYAIRLSLCCLLTWGLLWVTGKNMGEAARLWVFLLPWLLWMLGTLRATATNTSQTGPSPDWFVIALCQAAYTIVVCSRVGGFLN